MVVMWHVDGVAQCWGNTVMVMEWHGDGVAPLPHVSSSGP